MLVNTMTTVAIWSAFALWSNVSVAKQYVTVQERRVLETSVIAIHPILYTMDHDMTSCRYNIAMEVEVDVPKS